MENNSFERIFSHKYKTRLRSDADKTYSNAWLNWPRWISFNTCCCFMSNDEGALVTIDDATAGVGAGVVVRLAGGWGVIVWRSKVLRSVFCAASNSRNVDVASSRNMDRVVSRILCKKKERFELNEQ